MRPRSNRRVGSAEAAQLPPVSQDLGGTPPTLQITPVHERAKVGVAGGARNPEGPGQLVPVVDLGAARRQEEAGCGAEGVRSVHVVRRSVIVGADVVEDRDPPQRAFMERCRVPRVDIVQRSGGLPLEAEVDETVVPVGEEVHGPVPEVVRPPLPRLVTVDLAHHVERKAVQDLGRMGPLPVRERPPGFPLQLDADRLFEVLGGVHPVAVEPELAHPVGEPLDDVVARRPWVTGAREESVELGPLLIQAALPPPLLDQRCRKLHGIVPIGEDVREGGHQGAAHGRGVVPVGAVGARADPIVRPRGILWSHGPRVVDDGVHEDADATPVGRVDQRAQVVPGPQRRLHRGPVPGPVAVVSVGLPRPLVHAPVDLLHEGGQPDGVHAQAVEVPLLQLLEHTGEVPTLKAAQQRSVLRTAHGAIVAGITVHEAIGEEEVDRGVVPEHRGIRGCGRRDVTAWGGRAGGFVNARGQDERADADEGHGTDYDSHAPATSSSSRTRSVSAAASTRDAPPIKRA